MPALFNFALGGSIWKHVLNKITTVPPVGVQISTSDCLLSEVMREIEGLKLSRKAPLLRDTGESVLHACMFDCSSDTAAQL